MYIKLLKRLEHNTHKVIEGRQFESKAKSNYFSKQNEDVREFEELNCLLLNTIYTKTSDETKVMGRQIYALEEKEHKNDKNEIFACMHRNLDPLIMQTVIESQFSGLIEKTIEFFESCFCGRWITACLDYVRAHEWLTDLINTIMRLVKI